MRGTRTGRCPPRSTRPSIRAGVAALASLALLLASCGTSDQSPGDAEGSPSPAGATDRATGPPPLPGEPTDFGPQRGDRVVVVGVRHDQVLEVRRLPGTDQPLVTTLEPMTDGVRALGRSRVLADSFWTELRTDAGPGWAPLESVAHLGLTTDETAAAEKRLGTQLRAPSLERLGRKVAQAFASEDPPSSVALVRLPELGAVTYDVLGLGDDSVYGLRLQVFGTPADGDRPVTLVSVEQTTLCSRGVDPRTRRCV